MYYYIPIAEETKRPVAEWGGYPIDPEHDGIFTEIDPRWEWWAVVGNDTHDLAVIDIDLYKMDTTDHVEAGDLWYGLLDQTRIIQTQSGGIHLYFRVDTDEVKETIPHVDLKGDIGKGYAIHPITPGYEIANDEDPLEVNAKTFWSFPVFTDHSRVTPSKTGNWQPPCHDHAWVRRRASPARVYSVISANEYPEGINRPHPFHGSDGGQNFMVDEGGESFRCWRHEVTGGGIHLVGMEAGLMQCGEWSRANNDINWAAVHEYASEHGYNQDLSCEDVKNAGMCPYDCDFPSPQKW